MSIYLPHSQPRLGTQITELRFLGVICSLGEIEMIRDLPPPAETQEYRNMAEILRELPAQTRFSKTRSELANTANNLDRLATVVEYQSEGAVQTIAALNPERPAGKIDLSCTRSR